MALLPMAVYGLEVPAGDVAISARSDIPSAFNITMAAIDPSAAPEGEEVAHPRSTLKIIRQPLIFEDSEDDEDDSEDDDDFDADEMERMLAEDSSDGEDDDEDDEAVNGGPSDPTKSKAARKAAATAAIKKLLEQDEMDVDEAKTNGVKSKSAKALGKQPASDEDSDEESDDEDMEGAEIEEFVICTLDPTKQYQQTLNLTIGENERVWFKVSGTHTIYLTGNYVEPAEQHDHDEEYDSDDDEQEYDLSPDEDELDYDEEEDELDDMEDPRITELLEEEAPKLVEAPKKADAKKGKNKRAAEEEAAPSLDAMITESKAEPLTNGDAKLSKKQQKKLKKNDGTAAAAGAQDAPSSANGADKKSVQFAKELEQGPTPSKTPDAKPKTSTGIKTVQGVTIDDKKIGTGPAAKKGDRIGMRYIGKLQKDNKVFDSNKKGKPFGFKLGSGEVIGGWDIGVAGMSVGGERRITVPAHLAYGSKGAGKDIPPNATLIFDLKLMEINKGK
ncbi:hypothetical protein B0A48_03435 [Cryoendolithus antarcticus]|uniref:peptidylprolyl isomerase n=1 Tax=Cryoendolithus antarcticus TaxID=1507870 RepID=A0A1V8TKE7_9PEZI|nr:hypothetical protein B0A48_03435 [Cryoendolithus antarcticus]